MNKFFVGLLVLVAGIGIGWYSLKGTTPTPVKQEEQQVTTPTPQTTEAETPAGAAVGTTDKGGTITGVTVAYTNTGFTPNTVTVKVGTAVTFVNQSTSALWVASAVHPTHQLLPGFDELKSVNSGGSYTYVFAKVGTWKYHNHVNPSDIGSVVVTQ